MTALLALLATAQTVWISQLDLTKATQGWGTPQVDKSVDGHPITLHGQRFEHGFGTHAPGLLIVKLGGATRFSATVGIDDEVGRRGRAEFQVLNDKHDVIWRSGFLRGGDEPKHADVPLAGQKEIALRVVIGPEGFSYAHTDWADAKIEFEGQAPHTQAYKSLPPRIWLDNKPIQALNRRRLTSAAATPPMGWNSYDCFGDNVTEAEVVANANYVSMHLRPFGWDTMVVDYRWYDPGAHNNDANARAGAALSMDGFGRLQPAPNRFPSAGGGAGFKPLADRVHALGLKFGIHIMRGIPRNAVKSNLPIEGAQQFGAKDAANTGDPCPWCPDMFGVHGDTPAGQAYYDSIFRLYASWGVDYVKMDDTSSPYHTAEIEAVRKAITACGWPIVFSLSPGETPVSEARHVASHANLWRVSGDFWDEWGSVRHEFELGDRWRQFAGPGHWPDADMLPFGHLSIANRSVGQDRHTRFSKAEQVTVMTLWSLLNSPLMLGANLPDNDKWTLGLITNPEVLAVDQDAATPAAIRIRHTNTEEIWAKRMPNGSLAVGVFNVDDFDRDIEVDWKSLGLSGAYRVRDLWLRRPFARPVLGNFKVFVPAHSANLLLFTGLKMLTTSTTYPTKP